MKGQWLGTYTGSSEGTIIVNIDERSSHYQGFAYLHDNKKTLPSTAISFKTNNKDGEFDFRSDVMAPIDPQSGLPAIWDRVKQHYPEGVTVSENVTVKGSWNNNALSLSWKTNIGLTGDCVLPRSMADQPSEVPQENRDWETYKGSVANLKGRRYLFRGQTQSWRLRTSFHRAGRADLTRFLNEDIQSLRRYLSGRTKHVFNLDIPDEFGAFLNLVQHHGYPTPLLDWSYSPYIAAFFAYRGISSEQSEKADPGDTVRILVFDQLQWKEDWFQPVMLLNGGPFLSIGEFITIENDRMIPQQAASTVTNMDDIETYIRSKEFGDKKYLWAIDLPVSDREKVFQELSYMGITPGSLFPGLDGACEELKEHNFKI